MDDVRAYMPKDAVPGDMRILVVDDQKANVLLLERILRRGGYRNIESTTESRSVLALFIEFDPDIILLDLMMPELDGFQVMRGLLQIMAEDDYRPILVLTADATEEVKHRALASGAKDFLAKPFNVQEVLLRIENLLETRRLHRMLRGQNEVLEERVRERTAELESAYVDTVERLALAVEYRDDDTGQHTIRVGRTAALLARQLGLPEEEIELLRRAAGLHDIGKIGVPDTILLAPRKLSPEEFEVVKTHTSIGARILSGSRSPLLQMAETIAWTHHERWDGSGYARVSGPEIPLVGRITTVADVFDALTNHRPYKKAWPLDQAIAEIAAQSGRQFDPLVVDAFLAVHGREPRYSEPDQASA
jgi:putative two-component system response regulator